MMVDSIIKTKIGDPTLKDMIPSLEVGSISHQAEKITSIMLLLILGPTKISAIAPRKPKEVSKIGIANSIKKESLTEIENVLSLQELQKSLLEEGAFQGHLHLRLAERITRQMRC